MKAAVFTVRNHWLYVVLRVLLFPVSVVMLLLSFAWQHAMYYEVALFSNRDDIEIDEDVRPRAPGDPHTN